MKKYLPKLLLISFFISGCSNNTTNTAQNDEIILIDRDFGSYTENSITFPLDEPLEFTFFYHSSNLYAFDENWPVFEEMQRLTNISFKNTANALSTLTATEFQLEASSQFQSELYGGSDTSSLFMTYGPMGAFYSLDDYFEYLPNFSKYLAENPDVVASITSSDGKIYYIPSVTDGKTARAYFIREDWLLNLGLDIPKTVQDFEDVLIAFRDDDPNGNGQNDEIPYFSDNWLEMIRLVNLWDARCYSADNYTDRVVLGEDNKMYHTWTTDEFKTGIENISRWFDEGLIDPQIFTKSGTARIEYLLNDMGGMTHEWASSTSSYNNNTYIENFKFSIVAPPITELSNQWEEHIRSKVTTNGVAISTSCDEELVPILFSYLDYFWSEEGRILSNFGVENVHWTYVDGVPTFTDLILIDSPSVYSYLRENVGAQLDIGFHQDYRYELQWTHEVALDGINMYIENGYSDDLFSLPTLPYTNDENFLLNYLQYDINGYSNEQIQYFILNDWTLIDEQWDDYLAKLDSLGMQDLLDLYDTVYARFLSYKN